MLMQTIFSTYLGLQVPFTAFNIIFNAIPVYIGLRFLGRKFTILSIITIILSSVLTDLLPDLGLTQDPLLNCVFGGILYAFGSSLCLRADATTGGTDFIAMYMAQKHDRDAFGTIFIFNAIMLAVAGYLFGWDKAMYSIIYQFTVTQALHVFYKNYQKHTLFIITEKPADVYECIRISTHHGATLFRGIGLYEQKERNMVYSVVSSSEMRRVLGEVRRVDDHAFINIIKTDVFAGPLPPPSHRLTQCRRPVPLGAVYTQTRPTSRGRVCCVSFLVRRQDMYTADGPRAGAVRLRRLGDGGTEH